jgi:mono/diheme cytochrome c family protein
MKKVFKILLIIVSTVIIVLAGVLTYVKTALPNVGEAPALTVKTSPQIIERGRYIANAVAVCMDCHSKRDWSAYAGPLVSGTEGQGGELFSRDFGFPGNFYSKNITPASLSSWTDGELYRVITMGVDKNGNALFPVMPYHNYGQLADSDVHAVIAYLRTLKPITNEVPQREIDFPMNFIINTIPHKNTPAAAIPQKGTLDYGKYILTTAACGECHTKQEKGKAIPGMEFAGGFEFKMPGNMIVRSSNITPDKNTGIGNWTKDQFVMRFKMYSDTTFKMPPVKPGEFNTVMPWMMYAQMTEEDLEALYDYIMTIKPIENRVERMTN